MGEVSVKGTGGSTLGRRCYDVERSTVISVTVESLRRQMPKAKVRVQPIYFDDHYFTMEGESDRGCVLIACHVLDVALQYRLRFHLSRKRHVIKKAIDPLFENTRPLSSFWAKINLAYATSILDRWAFEDLHTIREMRNKLAHSHTAFTFDSPEIEPMVFSLQCTRIAYGYPDRAWSVNRSRKLCEAQAAEWNSRVPQLYFTIGFHYLHGYLTKGLSYKLRKKSQ